MDVINLYDGRSCAFSSMRSGKDATSGISYSTKKGAIFINTFLRFPSWSQLKFSEEIVLYTFSLLPSLTKLCERKKLVVSVMSCWVGVSTVASKIPNEVIMR